MGPLPVGPLVSLLGAPPPQAASSISTATAVARWRTTPGAVLTTPFPLDRLPFFRLPREQDLRDAFHGGQAMQAFDQAGKAPLDVRGAVQPAGVDDDEDVADALGPVVVLVHRGHLIIEVAACQDTAQH